MISSEVQRTLVKSPPELWAELSDPQALARHLGELGEIRITRAEPEKLVEWEAQEARGSVAIKASGWGTKVTLKASRDFTPPETDVADVLPTEAEPPEEPAIEAEPAAETEIPPEPEPATEPAPSGLDAWSRQEEEITLTAAERFGDEHAASLLGTDLQLAADREHESSPVEIEIERETVLETEAPEPRAGFLARLFGRARKNRAAVQAVPVEPLGVVEEPELTDEFESEFEHPLLITKPAPLDQPLGTTAPPPEEAPVLEEEPALEVEEIEPEQEAPVVDLAGELKAAEEAAEAEVDAILTSVLDRLGAAHHRPFSRS